MAGRILSNKMKKLESTATTSMTLTAVLVVVLLAMAPGAQASSGMTTFISNMGTDCKFILYDDIGYDSGDRIAVDQKVVWTFDTTVAHWVRVSIRQPGAPLNIPFPQSLWKVDPTGIYFQDGPVFVYQGPWDET